MEKSLPRKSRKNLFIELCRFLASLVIVGHHSDKFFENPAHILGWGGGWVFVEFFLILTGYLTTSHFRTHDATDIERKAVLYAINKLKKIFPYLAVGIFLMFIEWNLSLKLSLYDRVVLILNLPTNLLLVFSDVTQKTNTFCVTNWYMASIIKFLPLIIIIQVKFPKLYKYYLCWIVPVLLYSIGLMYWETIVVWSTTYCWIRALSGLMLGSCVYYLVFFIQCRFAYSLLLKCGFVFLRYFCFIFLVLMQKYYKLADVSIEVVFIVVLFLVSAFASNDIQVKSEWAEKIYSYLGRLSVPIYCIHFFFVKAIQDFFVNLNFNQKVFISMICSVLFAIFVMEMVRLIERRTRFISSV